MILLLVALATLVGALVQGLSGFGFSLVVAPVLVSTLGVRHGVQTVNVLAISVNALFLLSDFRRVRWREVGLLLGPAAVTALGAGFLVRVLDRGVLQIVAGTLTILGTIALARGLRLEVAHGKAGAVSAGAISGVMNVVGGIGGPPVALYAVHEGWSPAATRPTMQGYFLFLNAISLVALGLPAADANLGLGLAGLLLGWPLGLLLAGRISVSATRRFVYIVAIAGGAAAIAKGAEAL